MDYSPAKPERAARLSELTERLKDLGLRMTPQRKAILSTLVMHPGHPTAEELHKALLPEFPNMSLATVYKTLTRLKDVGEVQELQFSSRDNRFDGHNPRPHPHLICIKCDRVMDPDLPGLDGMIEELRRKTGYRVTSHRLDFFGLCPKCRNEP
jgi:Fur family peroxide stress response transcriptional regulator